MIHLYDCFGTASKLDWVFLENGGKCDCKRKSSLLVTIKTALISVGRRNWTLDDPHSIMNQLTVNLLTDWRASRAAFNMKQKSWTVQELPLRLYYDFTHNHSLPVSWIVFIPRKCRGPAEPARWVNTCCLHTSMHNVLMMSLLPVELLLIVFFKKEKQRSEHQSWRTRMNSCLTLALLHSDFPGIIFKGELRLI